MSDGTKMTPGGIAFGPPSRGPQHVEIAQALEVDVKRWRVRAEDAESESAEALRRVLVLREAYPALNSSENFLGLQRQLSLVEDRIAAARRFYNTRVVAYNERVDAFPSNLVAANRGFLKAVYFEAPA